jgi:hypothetical protein
MLLYGGTQGRAVSFHYDAHNTRSYFAHKKIGRGSWRRLSARGTRRSGEYVENTQRVVTVTICVTTISGQPVTVKIITRASWTLRRWPSEWTNKSCQYLEWHSCSRICFLESPWWLKSLGVTPGLRTCVSHFHGDLFSMSRCVFLPRGRLCRWATPKFD